MDRHRELHIHEAGNVYITTHLFETHVHPSSEKVTTNDGSFSRSTQTDLTWSDTRQFRDVNNINKCYRTYLHVNREAVRFLVQNDYCLEKCREEVSKCLARFVYHDGDTPKPKAMTAVSLTLNDDMKRLLKDVIEVLQGDDPDTKMRKLAIDCIHKNTRLMGIDLGSIVFIFQHSQEDADYMVSVTETDLQQEVKRILVDFLPDWVLESDLEWTFKWCKETAAGEDAGAADMGLGHPLQLGCLFCHTVSSGDLQRTEMEEIVDRKMAGQMSSLREHITNTAKQTLREFKHSMHMHQKIESDGLSDGDDDLYSDSEQLTSQTQEFDPNNLTEKGLVPNPGDSKQQHWRYGDTSNYEQHQTAEAAFVCETAAAGHESLRPHPKSLDEQASSANPHRNSSQAVGQRDEREKGEHESPRPHPKSLDEQASSVPASVNPHRNAFYQSEGKGQGEQAAPVLNPKSVGAVVDKENSCHGHSTAQGAGRDKSSESAPVTNPENVDKEYSNSGQRNSHDVKKPSSQCKRNLMSVDICHGQRTPQNDNWYTQYNNVDKEYISYAQRASQWDKHDRTDTIK